MSLDLTIESRTPVRHRGTGVFVREGGMTRELQTVEEVRQHFPDATNIGDIHITDYEDYDYFHLNMTHNLTEMASHVPIAGTEGHLSKPQEWRKPEDREQHPLTAYELLWHPELNPLLEQTTLHRRDDEDGTEWDVSRTRLTPEYVRQAMAAYQYIAAHREELSQYNPDNGWGDYDGLLRNVQNLVQCLVGIPYDDYDQYLIDSDT